MPTFRERGAWGCEKKRKRKGKPIKKKKKTEKKEKKKEKDNNNEKWKKKMERNRKRRRELYKSQNIFKHPERLVPNPPNIRPISMKNAKMRSGVVWRIVGRRSPPGRPSAGNNWNFKYLFG